MHRKCINMANVMLDHVFSSVGRSTKFKKCMFIAEFLLVLKSYVLFLSRETKEVDSFANFFPS